MPSPEIDSKLSEFSKLIPLLMANRTIASPKTCSDPFSAEATSFKNSESEKSL